MSAPSQHGLASAVVAPPAAVPDRVAVVCFGFSKRTMRRQPWHVAHGLATGFAARGHPVVLFTDALDPPPTLPYALERLPGLAPAQLRPALAACAAQRVYLVTGATALARMGPTDLGVPLTLVMASPRLHWRDILGLGRHLWHERDLLGLPLLNALLPAAVLRRGFRRSGAADVVYLSAAAQAGFAAAGLPAGRKLVPRIDPALILPPRSRNERPVICYLGPPLEARGAWSALRAFEAAVRQGLDADLHLLIRPDVRRALLQRYRARVERSPYAARIRLETRFLEPRQLRARLAQADIVLLPFRAPVSEVPLVTLEAGASGRLVVTLDAPGVGEYARLLGGIVVARPRDLPAALIAACAQPSPTLARGRDWTRWDEAVADLAEPASPDLAGLRFIGLAGVDGTGKTFLLAELRRRLDGRAIPHRHVWSRFRNYLSKPLLAVLRLTGHNRKETRGGVRVGYHDLQASPALGLLFLALQAVDQVLDLVVRYHLTPGPRLIVGDRCVLDTLVDLAVDTGRDRLVLERLGPWLMRLLPRQHCLVVLRRDPAAIVRDRPDVLADRHFARRRALYARAASLYGLPVIENGSDAATVTAAILDHAHAVVARGSGS